MTEQEMIVIINDWLHSGERISNEWIEILQHCLKLLREHSK